MKVFSKELFLKDNKTGHTIVDYIVESLRWINDFDGKEVEIIKEKRYLNPKLNKNILVLKGKLKDEKGHLIILKKEWIKEVKK